jgi:hypothetical protein
MKTILVSLSLALVASAASADTTPPKAARGSPAKAAPKKPNFGDSYDPLSKGRSSSGPNIVDTSVVRNVSERSNRSIKDKIDDLEVCWLKLPAAKRVAAAALLHVTVEASGVVTASRIDGELPAGVGKCITGAAARWTFPVGDARTELEHGISLTTH